MAKKSDDAGRALEFIIVHFLQRKYGASAVLKGITAESQIKDSKKFEALPLEQKEYYITHSRKIIDWIEEQFQLESTSFQVERLGDFVARRGDITDIRILTPQRTINLSIKHNHKAVKHQRPRSIAQWCGFEKKTPEDRNFRANYKSTINQFLEKAKNLAPEATLFKELKAIQNDFIDLELYQPVCTIVQEFINTHCQTEKHALFLFDFLIGKHDYYKLIVRKEGVSLMNFVDVPSAHQVKAQLRDQKYVDLHFSNNWEISMRIHTASSRIGDDLKFDSQPSKIGVKEILL